MTACSRLLDAIVPIVRTRLPSGVEGAYLDDGLDRNRWALEVVIEQNRPPELARIQPVNNAAFPDGDIREFWTASRRTAAAFAAMATIVSLYAQRRAPSSDERAVLAGFSGWGGLSTQAALAGSRWASARRNSLDSLMKFRSEQRGEGNRPPGGASGSQPPA